MQETVEHRSIPEASLELIKALPEISKVKGRAAQLARAKKILSRSDYNILVEHGRAVLRNKHPILFSILDTIRNWARK